MVFAGVQRDSIEATKKKPKTNPTKKVKGS